MVNLAGPLDGATVAHPSRRGAGGVCGGRRWSVDGR